MEWQDFLRKEARIHSLSNEEEETLLAALPRINEQINQIQLVNQLNIAEATLKSRLKEMAHLGN